MNSQLPNCPQCGSPGQLLYGGVEDYYFRFPGHWDFYHCSSEHCRIAWPFPSPDDAVLAAAYDYYYTHDAKPQGRMKHFLRTWLTRSLYRGSLAHLRTVLTGTSVVGWLVEDSVWSSGGIAPNPTGLVIDIGCGSGERLALLSSIGWGSAIGVEPDTNAMRVGIDLGRDIRIGSAEALPFGPSSADATVMHHVIEHVRHPQRALAEAFRVLKSKGVLVVITPNIASQMRLKWGRYWRGLEAPRHLTIFSVEALRSALSAAGFQVEIAQTTARSDAWIDMVSATASGLPTPAMSLVQRLATAAKRFHEQQRLINKGVHVGDEIVAIARKPETMSAANAGR